MNTSSEPFVFECDGSQLVGMIHRPEQPSSRGVLIVVGGPQYRVGSHRQFVLLARDLAAAGFTTMRFDHRGAGDSDGPDRDFEHLDPDISAALDAFRQRCPEVREIVIWGLCDAASAALFHVQNAPVDAAVSGLVLLNPWIRTEQGEARSYLTHYYGRRILQGAFWKKLLSGEVSIVAALQSFGSSVRSALGASTDGPASTRAPNLTLPERMLSAFSGFDGPMLIIISGNDLTAAEFESHANSPEWQASMTRPQVRREYLPDSDHTFSRRAWRDAVSALTIKWLSDT